MDKMEKVADSKEPIEKNELKETEKLSSCGVLFQDDFRFPWMTKEGKNLMRPESLGPGALKNSSPKVALFMPLKLRGVELKNRIVVSPMCQYSAKDGE